ncbi:MAG: hypothetical protein ACM3U2_04305 [Deltaproteobacteria bacterium]
MLPVLSQTASRSSRRVLVLLGAAAAMLALPTLQWAPDVRVAAADDRGSAAQSDKKAAEPATTPATASTVEYLPRPSKDEQKILDALAKPTTIEFLALPLEDCLTFLKHYHNLNVWIDKATLAKEEINLDQRVTLDLTGVSLRSVLNLMLEPLELAYLVEDDVLKITTKGGANKLITRTYPINDLYLGRVKVDDKAVPDKAATNDKPAVRRAGDLEWAIMNAVEPDSWETLSGPGTCTYVEKSGSLVIRQTWGTHMKVLELLRDLREAKTKAGGETGGDKK